MSILFSMFLLQASLASADTSLANPTPAVLPAAISNPETPAPLRKFEKPLQCRIMVLGMSRSGDVTICRTKAAWRELESCRGPTRYCSPEQKAAIAAKHTAFGLSENSRIICRVVSATGSRLRSQQLCMPQREWQRMWDESSSAAFKMQDRSKRVRELGQ
jgi:hypothetical protein